MITDFETDLASALEVKRAISAINPNGSRKVAFNSPFAHVEFETTKFRSLRFSIGCSWSNKRWVLRAISRMLMPSTR